MSSSSLEVGDGGVSTSGSIQRVHFQSYGNQTYLLVVDDTYPN